MRYALVSQHNWRQVRTRDDGSKVTAIGYRPPPTMAHARHWPGTEVVEQPAAEPPPVRWGHGTYVERDGRMVLVASDFDTSG